MIGHEPGTHGIRPERTRANGQHVSAPWDKGQPYRTASTSPEPCSIPERSTASILPLSASSGLAGICTSGAGDQSEGSKRQVSGVTGRAGLRSRGPTQTIRLDESFTPHLHQQSHTLRQHSTPYHPIACYRTPCQATPQQHHRRCTDPLIL